MHGQDTKQSTWALSRVSQRNGGETEPLPDLSAMSTLNIKVILSYTLSFFPGQSYG